MIFVKRPHFTPCRASFRVMTLSLTIIALVSAVYATQLAGTPKEQLIYMRESFRTAAEYILMSICIAAAGSALFEYAHKKNSGS